MKVSRSILFGFLWISIFAAGGCDKQNKCENIDCFTPPPYFVFNIVESENGENVFASGLYDIKYVEVSDGDEKWVKHQYNNYPDSNFIILPEIGWTIGEAKYHIRLDGETDIELLLNMEESHENCCTFFKLIEFNMLNYPFSIIDSTGVIRVEI